MCRECGAFFFTECFRKLLIHFELLDNAKFCHFCITVRTASVTSGRSLSARRCVIYICGKKHTTLFLSFFFFLHISQRNLNFPAYKFLTNKHQKRISGLFNPRCKLFTAEATGFSMLNERSNTEFESGRELRIQLASFGVHVKRLK